MNCPNCGAQNPEEYRFCNKCGTPLREAPPTSTVAEPLVKVRLCPKCGKMSPFYAWNCYACGETLGINTIKEVNASEVHYPEDVGKSKDNVQMVKDNVINREDASSSMPAPMRQQTEYDTGGSYSSQKETSTGYGALRGIAALCQTLSNIVAGIAGLGAFLCLFIIGDNVALGLGGIFLCAILGGLAYVILRIMAEGVSVILDIEVNTHRAAEKTRAIEQLLVRLLSQKDIG